MDGEGSLTKAGGICSPNIPPSCPANTPNVASTPTPTPGATTPTEPPPLSTNTTLGPYTRSLRFELNPTQDVMMVTGYTVWSTRAGKHEAKLVSTLTKWQTIATLVPIQAASTPVCSDQSLVTNPNPTPGVRPPGTQYYMTKCEGREPRDNAAALCRAGRSFLCDPTQQRRLVGADQGFSTGYWMSQTNSGLCSGCFCNPESLSSCGPNDCARIINSTPGGYGYTTGGRGSPNYLYGGGTCPNSADFTDPLDRFAIAPATDLKGALCCNWIP